MRVGAATPYASGIRLLPRYAAWRMTDPRSLRRASGVMLALSAAVCLALMVAAGRQSPVLLAVLFCAWVLSPFLGLALCSRAAVRLMRRAGVDASIAAL